MGIFSFRTGPTYRAASPDEQMTAALDMPMSLTSTLSEQFKGGILDSLGLGTVIREAALPEEAPTQQLFTTRGPTGELITLPDTPQMRRRATVQGFELQRETQQQLDVRRRDVGALAEDQYKSSAYYREGVKWDAGMTEDRAAALAEAYDAKRVREYFATKRPITSFFGNLAGQAVDPINYIPVAGPAVKAANAVRFGRVAGAAATSALDAAANTAIASGVTFEARQAMGDDITWQSTISDIAMSALIGGAFGSIGGAIDVRRAGKLAVAEAAARDRLSTLRNVQDARVALNSAIDGIARGGDVNLGANGADAAQRIANLSNPVWSPEAFASIDRQGLFSTTSVGRFIDNRAPLVQDFETAIRNQVLAGDAELAARFTAAEAKFKQAQEAVAAIEEPLAARTRIDSVSLIDPVAGQRLAAIETELARTVPAARRAALEAERDVITESIPAEAIAKAESDFRIGPTKQAKAARKSLATARQGYSKARAAVDTVAQRIRAENSVRYQASVDLSPAKPEPIPMGRAEAETRVAKPETYKTISEQYRVNADDGSFVEQADIEQLRQEGRVTPEDEASLVEADATYENGVSYGEALRSVVSCLI